MKIKLTVLMTVYNDEKYISESVHSILNQSYSNFIFLIINDASSDSTRKIIESIYDRRIKVINLKENIGQTAALNYGLENIDTEYVIRMDADDISDSSRFSKMMKLALKKDFDFIGTNCIEFDAHGVQNHIKKYEFSRDIYSNYYRFNCTPFVHGSLLFKYKSIKALKFFNEKYKICADLDLYNKIYFNEYKYKIYNLQEPLYYVRRHGNQMTKNKLALREAIIIKTETLLGLLSKFEFIKFLIVLSNILYFLILYLRPNR